MRRSTSTIAAGLLALILAGSPGTSRAQDSSADPWAVGSNWISLRAGYAKASGNVSGNGGAGYGFGYARMLKPVKLYRWTLLRQFSLGAYLHHEALDHFHSSVEIEVPATVELVRHFRWRTPLHPYLGVGTGAFYRKAYRTSADSRSVAWGSYLTFGANAPIASRHLLGFDARMIRLDASYDPPDPVFGAGTGEIVSTDPLVVEAKNGTRWSAKINYTIAY